MDTACADGWSKALGEIAAVPFKTLIPGHGAVMTRADFADVANRLRQFRRSAAARQRRRSSASPVGSATPRNSSTPDHKDYVDGAAGYYLETRLRSSPEEQQRYCKPLKAS